MRLILASSSPRRRDLLARLEVPFSVRPSEVEEPPPESSETPDRYARRLAKLKADDVSAHFPDHVVLGADTVVAIDGELLGKPADEVDALRMLRRLRGRWHTVVTGVAVRGPLATEGSVSTRVHMRNADDDELSRYIATGEPMDKAGAYAVQGRGGSLVDTVEGCYETVVGLPLCLVRDLLESAGVEVASDNHCSHSSGSRY